MSIPINSGSAAFPKAGRDDWLGLVARAIRGRSLEDVLVSRTEDGIRIDALPPRNHGARHETRRRLDQPWTIVQRIDDVDPRRANAQALEDLAGGATGLSLVFEGAPNAFGYGLPATPEALECVLEGIAPDRTHLRVDVHPASRVMADWLVAYLGRRRTNAAKLSLSFGIDPAAIFAGTGRLRMSIEALQASMPQSLAHFFAMGLPGVLLEADGRVYHNAGATEAQELGAVLAAAVAHLRLFEEARQALVYAAPHIGFAVAVDQDQFLSMAKIRALRKLWARVLEACSIASAPVSVHAETSFRMMAAGDAESNILRGAIAAFAAAAGGADSISVLPYTAAHGLAAGAARRIARNTQLVMAAESHVDFVADPGAGAAAVEALTVGLCEAAWAEFQQIEREGGILASLAKGHVQDRVLGSRKRRAEALRSGARHIVGTTLYAPAEERPIETLAAPERPVPGEGSVTCTALLAQRLDQTWESAA